MTLQDIIALDEQYYMRTFGSRLPVSFTHGEGAVLYDTQNKAYVDFVAGIAVNSLGYNHPAITAAVCEQAQKVMHTSSLFYIEAQAKLAQLIVDNSCADRVFIGNSGAEANEAAVKLVRKYFYAQGIGRYEIITTYNSFHGRTLSMVAATGQPKYQAPYQPLPQGFVNVNYNDIDAVKAAITDKTAAVMVEPIQGESGVIVPDGDYLAKLRKLCDDEGILLIYDEVQTGMGRTGKLFAYQHDGVEPDIFTLAKALGGGVPIGALAAKQKVCAFAQGDHGSTFGGNPLACAAGVAVFTTMLAEDMPAVAAQKGAYLVKKLEALQSKYAFVSQVRGKGLLVGMQLNDAVPGAQFVGQMLQKGFIINCAGNNTLRFVPPFVVTTQQMDDMVAALDALFAAVG